jgi:hypothetical protein
VVDTELAAADGENDGCGRELLDEIGVVVAASLETVAAANQEEAGDVAFLNFFQDNRSESQDLFVAGANGESGGTLGADRIRIGELFVGLGESGFFLGGFEKRSEVDIVEVVADVLAARPADSAGSEEASANRFGVFDEAVGGHQNRPREVREF